MSKEQEGQNTPPTNDPLPLPAQDKTNVQETRPEHPPGNGAYKDDARKDPLPLPEGQQQPGGILSPPVGDEAAPKKQALAPTIDNNLAMFDEKFQKVLKVNLGGNSFDWRTMDRIIMPSGKIEAFAIPEKGEMTAVKEFDAILLFKRRMRSWWPEDESSQGMPPSCACINLPCGYGIGDPGDPKATPTGPQQYSCETCYQNQWGSGKDETGKACKEKYWLFLKLSGKMFPVSLAAPTMSIRPVIAHLTVLTEQLKMHYQAITHFSLKAAVSKNKKDYFQLVVTESTKEHSFTAEEIKQAESWFTLLEQSL